MTNLATAGEGTSTGAMAVRREHQRVLRMGAAVLIVFAVLMLWLGNVLVSRHIRGEADSRIADAAARTTIVLEQLLRERGQQLHLLASDPTIVAAARAGDARAQSLGIVGRDIKALESQFDATRTLDVDPAARRFLLAQLEPLEIAEAFVTDRNGYNAVTTQKTSDFVQNDEGWWTDAMKDGRATPSASFDESARQAVISLAAAVRDRDTDTPAGAIKVAFGLRSFDDALDRTSAASGIRVDLVDAQARVIAGASSQNRLAPIAGLDSTAFANREGFDFGSGDDAERALIMTVAGVPWRIVAHVPNTMLESEGSIERMLVDLGIGGVTLILLGALFAMGRVLDRRIVAPAGRLARAAAAVADGDFRMSRDLEDAQEGQLDWATRELLGRLRDLAGSMRRAAHETGAMSAEISASAEEMAASAQHVAETSNDLSRQSTEMSQTINELATDAQRLAGISTNLANGAQDGVARNQQLRALAAENRGRLEAGAAALERLADDVRSNAAAVESLVAASAEIRDFVTLVRKMAKQSKLLALNAAMEAARAGEQGQGFAVVASEVRRLAASSAESAERTEALVNAVLERVSESQELAARNVESVHEALSATRQGLASFAEVESAVEESESWTASIDHAAASTNSLVAETTARLDELARHTESFAAAMQEVAATSEEQSASTEEISASAADLGRSADRLLGIVGGLRMEDDEVDPNLPSTRDHAVVKAEHAVLPASGRLAPA